MKSGEILTDTSGQSWTLGTHCGDGTWGSVFLARSRAGAEAAIKIAHPGMEPIVREQRQAFERPASAAFASLTARIRLPDGREAFAMPVGTPFEEALEKGLSVVEAIRAITALARQLDRDNVCHGHLTARNVFRSRTGQWFLTDPASPALSRALRDDPWTPPEVAAGPMRDTWALCQLLFLAVQRGVGADDRAELVDHGLDKVDLASVKEACIRALKRGGANPRFIVRTASRICAVLSRGLSAETQPSPPYRFRTVTELVPRLQEICSLLAPSVTDVGRLLLGPTAQNQVFRSNDEVSFSVTVATSAGIQDHEDLVCGMRVRDLDAEGDGRVSIEDGRFDVRKHPSGRMRFEFGVPNLSPGRYEVTVAFSVKESGEPPVVSKGRFEVRPAPGYVPPAREPESTNALRFPKAATPRSIASDATVASAGAPSDPGTETGHAEVIDVLFPRPLAPTTPGTEPYTDAVTEAVRPIAVGQTEDPSVVEVLPRPNATPSVTSSPIQPSIGMAAYPSFPSYATNPTVPPTPIQATPSLPRPVAPASVPPMAQPKAYAPQPASFAPQPVAYAPTPTPISAPKPSLQAPRPAASRPGLAVPGPSIAMPRPKPAGLAMPPVSIAPPATDGLGAGNPEPLAPPTAQPSVVPMLPSAPVNPTVDEPVARDWLNQGDDLSAAVADDFYDSPLGGFPDPSNADELPTWDGASRHANPLSDIVFRLQELLQRDTATAPVVAALLSGGFLVMVLLLMKAC